MFSPTAASAGTTTSPNSYHRPRPFARRNASSGMAAGFVLLVSWDLSGWLRARKKRIVLPSEARQDAQDDDQWGELHLRAATPDAGGDWTDDGSQRKRRQLKHRAEGDSRIVPAHPDLTRILRIHLAEFGTDPGGHLFTGVRGGELPTIT
jgi:hypothetical protein